MKLIIILVSILLSVISQAQNISGKITDPEGIAVEGATIILQKMKLSTFSNSQGEFKINLPESSDSLLITHVLFEEKRIAVKFPLKKLYEIILNRKENTLSEVIVSTGYEMRNVNVATGAFNVVDNTLLNRQVSTNILSRLQGVVPALAFNKDAESREEISIRGRSTIFSNAQPLIVLDNFPYEGSIDNINPKDVESITILKDAAAASIWGARAGNGVIVITTKSASFNKPVTINFSSNVTFGSKPDFYWQRRLASDEFIEMERLLFNNGLYNSAIGNTYTWPSLSPAVLVLLANKNGEMNSADTEKALDSLKQIDNRDDLKKLFHNSVSQSYGLSILGGGFKNGYYVFGGFDKTIGTTKEENQRLTLRAENNFTPFGSFKIRTGVSVTSSTARGPKIERHISAIPYMRLIDDNGNPLPSKGVYRQSFLDQLMENGFMDWGERPAEDVLLRKTTSGLTDIRLSLNASQPFLKFFSASFNYQFQNQQGITSTHYNEESFFVRDLVNRFTQIDPDTKMAISHPMPKGDILDQEFSRTTANNGRTQVDFYLNKPDFEISALGGIEIREVISGGNTLRYYGYNPDIMLSKTVDFANRYLTNPSSGTQAIPGMPHVVSDITDRFRSYYTNAYFTFKKLYTISASARKDESNLFGVNSNQRGIPLWSAGVRYNISKEKFYGFEWLPDLQLRATYGINGNINKSLTAYTTVIMSTNKYNQMSADLLSPPNPDLCWESSAIINLGMDFESKNRILSGSLDFYWKKGYDLIGYSSIDPTSGITLFQGNVADMRGKGVDLQLMSKNIQGLLTWQTTWNFSFSTDEVAKYNPQPNVGDLLAQRISPFVGKPVYGIYAYKWGGLSNTGEPQGYLDHELTADYSEINRQGAEKLIYKGAARPVYFGNLLNTISYKNISISANILFKARYMFRRPSINYSNAFYQYMVHSDYSLRWQKAGDEHFTNVPSLVYPPNSSRDGFYNFSEALIENGSHIRVQNIRLNYSIPGSGKHFKRIEIYGYVNQLGILWRSNKQNIDPDFINAAPPSKSYSLGINAQF